MTHCANPLLRRNRDGKNKFLHESRKAHYIFPKNGLAGVVKKNSTMSGEATNGGIFFYHNC